MLNDYLQAMSHSQLVDHLLTLISQDHRLYDRWQAKIERAQTKQDFKSLKKLITKGLPLKSIWEYRKVADYFENAEQLIADVFAEAEHIPSEDQLKLVFAVYERLDKVHERLDDSGGYRFVLMRIIATNLTKIFRRQPWSSEQRADWLIQMINDGHEEFPLIPDDFKLTDEEQDICLFYLEEKMFDKAVCWLDNHVADKYLLKDAACLLITHNPQKAIEYCRQALTHLLNISNNAS